MTITYHIREGTTEPIDITLKDGTDAASITGYSSVSLYLRSIDGTAEVEKSTTDGISVTSAATGAITVTFGSTDLEYSKLKYNGYIIVVDGTGARSSFPSDGEFVFQMHERFSGDG